MEADIFKDIIAPSIGGLGPFMLGLEFMSGRQDARLRLGGRHAGYRGDGRHLDHRGHRTIAEYAADIWGAAPCPVLGLREEQE